MKTSILFMIVMLLAICSMTFAQTETGREPFSVSIPLKTAIKHQGLVQAMYQQLNEDFLHGPAIKVYHVKVEYRSCLYDIYGSYEEWTLFFVMDNKAQIPVNTGGE